VRDPTVEGNKTLVFPSWFPAYLEPDVHHLYADGVRRGFKWKLAMIERLVNNPRMQRVWRELSERKRDRKTYRKTPTFEHSAVPPEFQQTAIRDIFLWTANTAVLFDLFSETWNLERAAELRADANRLRQGRPRRRCAGLANKLTAAAAAYEEADQLRPLTRGQVIKAVTEIAARMRELFGSTKLALTATLASVALDLKITPSNVREWVGRPVKRRTKRPLGKQAQTARFSQSLKDPANQVVPENANTHTGTESQRRRP
jgi:hypothetical protein